MTDESEEWGPVIQHGGSPTPGCEPGNYIRCWTTAVGIAFGLPEEAEGLVEAGAGWDGVEKFRIRRPRALRELREMIQNLPVREDA